MAKRKKRSDVVEILKNRYIGDSPERAASLELERVNAEVARTIYELRQESGLTQKQLADLIGTTQSVISRLEDADCEGHSLSILSRIAKALNKQLAIRMAPKNGGTDVVRYAFAELMRGLRRQRGLKVSELADELDVDEDELISIEHDVGYKPDPLTIFRVSKLFKIPQHQLAMLVGAINDIPVGVREHASAFAAKSDSFAKLSDEEKQALDEFVRYLKSLHEDS